MFGLTQIMADKSTSKEEKLKRVAEVRLPEFFRPLSFLMPTIVIGLSWSIPSLFAFEFVSRAFKSENFEKYAYFALAPAAFALCFFAIVGFFGFISKFAIVPGKFPRNYMHPVYAFRRVYGTAWTQLFYFKPLYSVCLAVPLLRKCVFGMFGYKGSHKITIYPDAWIRDLPLLKVSEGVYIANRCCLGTNLCINDDSILVGPVTMKKGAMVGHLAIFGLGSEFNEGSELGVGAATGIRIKVEAGGSLSPRCNVNHGAVIGEKAKIGTAALVGTRARIGAGVDIRAGACIPPGVVIENQKQADDLFFSESEILNQQRENVVRMFRDNIEHEKASGRY